MFEFRGKVVEGIKKGIALAKEVGSKRVITFTGMRFEGMDEEKAAADCVAAWKDVVGDAEKAGVTVVMEHLNSRDDSHPMKGHPGYRRGGGVECGGLTPPREGADWTDGGEGFLN